ncbi:hypothetical protein BRE01_66350 [Brevibacillus reuszeri]|uniref:Uncharacterized protein n=1 Tax=Brevibacillus reuszeri TaxID=54915 RepID=A0A0K9YU18_9BACL|nr:hypothetical protein [Brevibacillus reuszeri]KNB72142.1 hypothetical protein ADS79_14360 [Brevibacillus reuszeri]MED1859667.1 hypothetical protein [Brevibacillus reuszeri]GED72933.1 hypothetical protein BRE01_66350 [Brevibacillus reuszeri]
MGQLIAVILNVMVLLVVPLGILQAHTVIQARNELLEVSAAAAKYVSNHGGMNEALIQQEVRAYISRELTEKRMSLSEPELAVTVTRIRAADPILWSHEDEFVLQMSIPFPQFTMLIPMPAKTLQVIRQGTINVMDYDLS